MEYLPCKTPFSYEFKVIKKKITLSKQLVQTFIKTLLTRINMDINLYFKMDNFINMHFCFVNVHEYYHHVPHVKLNMHLNTQREKMKNINFCSDVERSTEISLNYSKSQSNNEEGLYSIDALMIINAFPLHAETLSIFHRKLSNRYNINVSQDDYKTFCIINNPKWSYNERDFALKCHHVRLAFEKIEQMLVAKEVYEKEMIKATEAKEHIRYYELNHYSCYYFITTTYSFQKKIEAFDNTPYCKSNEPPDIALMSRSSYSEEFFIDNFRDFNEKLEIYLDYELPPIPPDFPKGLPRYIPYHKRKFHAFIKGIKQATLTVLRLDIDDHYYKEYALKMYHIRKAFAEVLYADNNYREYQTLEVQNPVKLIKLYNYLKITIYRYDKKINDFDRHTSFANNQSMDLLRMPRNLSAGFFGPNPEQEYAELNVGPHIYYADDLPDSIFSQQGTWN